MASEKQQSSDDSSQIRVFWIAAAVVVGLGAAFGAYRASKDKVDTASRNALFVAEAQFDKELAALVPEVPAPSAKASAAPSAPSVAQQKEQFAFKRLEVDKSFPESVKKFESVITQFGSSRSAFEARIKLAALYARHGDAERAARWYDEAQKSAPNSYERSAALLAQAIQLENQKKPAEALDALDRAFGLGEKSFQAEIWLAQARNQEALGKKDKAINLYNEIQKHYPNTPSAQYAEILKTKLSGNP